MSLSGDQWNRVGTALLAVGVASLVAGTAVGVFVGGAQIGFGVTADGDGVTHENPDVLTTGDSLSAFEQQLADRLASRLRRTSRNVSTDAVRRARSLLNGSKYESLFSTYANLSDGGRTRSPLVRADRLLRSYLATTDAYWDTYRNYSLAWVGTVGIGHQRTLARRLGRLAARANATGTELVALARNSTVLQNKSIVSIPSIRASLKNITQTTRQLRERVFTGTRLTALPASHYVSVADPLIVSGRLTTENGTGLTHRRVTLDIGPVNRSVTTDAQGRYTITYQPVYLPANETTATIRYVPNVTARFAGTTASIAVVVEPTTPSVSIDPISDPARYGETLSITGRVSVDGSGVPRVPVIATIDGQYLGRTRTAESGRFTFDASLPATVSPGRATVRVRVVGANTSVEPVTATEAVPTRARDTHLSLAMTELSGRLIRVTGEVRLDSGAPVGGQWVTVSVGDETVATAETGANGTFATTVRVPDTVTSSGLFGGTTSARLNVTFSPAGGLLRPAQAGTTVIVETGSALPVVLGVAVVVIALGGIVYVGYGRAGSASPSTDDSDTSREPDPMEFASGADDEAVLAYARDQQSAGHTERAIRASYAAVRTHLDTRLADDRSATHWEFYAQCRDAGIEEGTLDALSELTTLYERAVFADETVASEAGARAIEIAADCVESD